MRLQCCPSSMLRSPLCPSVVECRQFQHPALFSYYGLPDADDACAHAARCCCACVVQRQFWRPSELSFRSRRSASSPSRVVRYLSGYGCGFCARLGVVHKVHGRRARPLRVDGRGCVRLGLRAGFRCLGSIVPPPDVPPVQYMASVLAFFDAYDHPPLCALCGPVSASASSFSLQCVQPPVCSATMVCPTPTMCAHIHACVVQRQF
jgi:hypothetical protein